MCGAPKMQGISKPVRRFPAHEKLDQVRASVSYFLKGAGGKPKLAADSTDAPPRFLFSAVVVLACCLLLNQVGLFVPLVMITRNCVMPKMPQNVRPKYPACPAAMLGKEMTIVVSVKDACSQAPGFIRSLEKFAPPSVHLIYTFPNFETCASIDLKDVLKRWEKTTVLPLPLRSSPMQGWVDAIPYIKTKYSMLLHNDGSARTRRARCARRARACCRPAARA